VQIYEICMLLFMVLPVSFAPKIAQARMKQKIDLGMAGIDCAGNTEVLRRARCCPGAGRTF
jgi:hypothetical protein